MGQYDIYPSMNITDEGGLLDLFQYINVVSDGIFFTTIVGVMFFISFIIGLRMTTPARSLTFSCFICMVSTMILSVLELVTPKIMYLFILGFAVGLWWVKQDE
jgi:hypothetical protein